MGMLIACARGCGHTIEVSTEQIEEATQHGGALVVEHEVCPTDPKALKRRFKVVTQVYELQTEAVDDVVVEELPEPLCSIGHTLEAGSFKLALEPLGRELTRQWAVVMGMADVIDQPAPDIQPDQEGSTDTQESN